MPDHAVHRRADLVAHRREELALRARGAARPAASRQVELLAVDVIGQRPRAQEEGPVAAHADLNERDAEVEEQLHGADVRLLEEVQLHARVVEQREDDVLRDDQQRAGPHADPVLVDDHHRERREEPEVHLGEPVHLVDVQRDERLQRDARHAARDEVPGQEHDARRKTCRARRARP